MYIKKTALTFKDQSGLNNFAFNLLMLQGEKLRKFYLSFVSTSVRIPVTTHTRIGFAGDGGGVSFEVPPGDDGVFGC